MDMGRETERSVLVLRGVGESRAGPSSCFGEEEEGTSLDGGWLGGDEVAVGDFGGPPNADINDNTMQGVSVHHSLPCSTWPTSGANHFRLNFQLQSCIENER